MQHGHTAARTLSTAHSAQLASDVQHFLAVCLHLRPSTAAPTHPPSPVKHEEQPLPTAGPPRLQGPLLGRHAQAAVVGGAGAVQPLLQALLAQLIHQHLVGSPGSPGSQHGRQVHTFSGWVEGPNGISKGSACCGQQLFQRCVCSISELPLTPLPTPHPIPTFISSTMRCSTTSGLSGMPRMWDTAEARAACWCACSSARPSEGLGVLRLICTCNRCCCCCWAPSVGAPLPSLLSLPALPIGGRLDEGTLEAAAADAAAADAAAVGGRWTGALPPEKGPPFTWLLLLLLLLLLLAVLPPAAAAPLLPAAAARASKSTQLLLMGRLPLLTRAATAAAGRLARRTGEASLLLVFRRLLAALRGADPPSTPLLPAPAKLHKGKQHDRLSAQQHVAGLQMVHKRQLSWTTRARTYAWKVRKAHSYSTDAHWCFKLWHAS